MRMVVRLAAALATLAVFATAVQSMSNYRWKKRPLVVFAESDGSPLLAEQRQIVSRNRSDLNKRDVVVVWVVGRYRVDRTWPAAQQQRDLTQSPL